MFVALVLMRLSPRDQRAGDAADSAAQAAAPVHRPHLPQSVLGRTASRTRQEAITELSRAVSAVAGLPPDLIEAAVSMREELMATGIGAAWRCRTDGSTGWRHRWLGSG